ncbi:YjbQ family protein, partial [Aspergillus ibericus CBS 121593]
MWPKSKYTVLGLLAAPAAAITRISNDEMNQFLNHEVVELANRYAPLWFFSQAVNQPPCYPTWAFGGSPTSSDVYDAAHKTPAAPQCEYPNVGCKCRNPGVARGNPGPAFPIYYTFKKCNETEVRVAYNLFYEKDGAEVLDLIDTGHDYDWERVIIIHSRDANNTWAPSRALLSAHSGYHNLAWGSIHSTLTTAQINAGSARQPDGVRNNDHPKVYVSWSKHAHFDTRDTVWIDPLSQSLDNAYRSDDWWYYADPKDYIRSDNSTAAGKAFWTVDWGSATSNPPYVQESQHDPKFNHKGESKMSWTQKTLTLPSRSRGSYLITDEIISSLPEIKNYKVGLLHLFIQHTSCALSLNENWDDDVRADMSDALDRIAPYDKKGNLYRHSAEGEDDMPAHIKSALIGASVTIPITNGRLATGTWQGIWYLEFRAARHSRKVVATIQGEKA